MTILERVIGIRRSVAAAHALRRLRVGRAGGRPAAAPGAGAVPRPAPPRPGEDPVLAARLGRWRGRAGAGPGADPPAGMSTAERDAAMLQLADLRARLDGEQADLIDAALTTGRVAVRRLGPGDGHLWEMPGMRVFAIAGVQAFTVRDEPEDAPR